MAQMACRQTSSTHSTQPVRTLVCGLQDGAPSHRLHPRPQLKATEIESDPERKGRTVPNLKRKRWKRYTMLVGNSRKGRKMDRLTRWFGDEATAPSNPNAAIQRCCEYEDSMLSPAGVQRLIALCPDGYESILKTKDKDLLVVGTIW